MVKVKGEGKRAILEHVKRWVLEISFNHGEGTKSHTRASKVSLPVLLEWSDIWQRPVLAIQVRRTGIQIYVANLGAELGNTDKFIGCATSILSRLTDCMKILVTTFWNCFKTNPLDFLNYPPRWKMPRIFPAEKFSVPAENFGKLPDELSRKGVCSAGC